MKERAHRTLRRADLVPAMALGIFLTFGSGFIHGSGDLGECVGPAPGALASDGWSPWFALSGGGPEGADCLLSATPFVVGERSVVTAVLTGPGVLSFQWSVSSQENDGNLTCEILNGSSAATLGGISGEGAGWATMDVFIPRGETTVNWVYQKKTSNFYAAGDDAGRLANISYAPASASPQTFQQFLTGHGITGEPGDTLNGLRFDTCWLMSIDPTQPAPESLRGVTVADGKASLIVRYSLTADGFISPLRSEGFSGWNALGLESRLVPGTLTAESVEIEFTADAKTREFFRRFHTPFFEVPDITPPSGYAYLPPGNFLRSSPLDEIGRYPGTENFRHQVTLTRGFFIKHYETTLGEWNTVRDWARANGYPTLGYKELSTGTTTTEMGECGGRFLLNSNGGDISNSGAAEVFDLNQPVSNVSFYHTLRWLNAKSEMEGLTPCYSVRLNEANGSAVQIYREQTLDALDNDLSAVICDWTADGYRLPTEAEWEYACRAGTNTALNNGENLIFAEGQLDPLNPGISESQSAVDEVANYWANGAASQPVGSKAPNALGLYDMHGNINEWCWDTFNLNLITPFSGDPTTNPRGQAGGIYRTGRGGSWRNSERLVRSSSRHNLVPSLQGGYQVGFRIARTAPE